MAGRLRAGQLECRAGSRNVPLLSGVRRVSLRVACALAGDRVSDGPHVRDVPTGCRRPGSWWTDMHQPHPAVFRSAVGPPGSRHPATGRRAVSPCPRLRVEESERCAVCGVHIQARASTPYRTEFSAWAFSSSSSMPHGKSRSPSIRRPGDNRLEPHALRKEQPLADPRISKQRPSHHRSATDAQATTAAVQRDSSEDAAPPLDSPGAQRIRSNKRARGQRAQRAQREE